MADLGVSPVVVLNQAGKLRFRYTGPPLSSKKEPFQPFGITTASQGRILTSDCFNHCVHIFDVDGLFLSYIDNCDLKYPYGLCVDNNDILFVCGFDKENVKRIRYLK